MNDLEKFKDETIESLQKQFGGIRINYIITSHGQSYGNKWIIKLHDFELEIIIRDKLYKDDYNVDVYQRIHTISLHNPTCFEQIEKLIRS